MDIPRNHTSTGLQGVIIISTKDYKAQNVLNFIRNGTVASLHVLVILIFILLCCPCGIQACIP